MSEYSIQKIDSDNFSSLVPLVKDCFGTDVSIDYFRWKYLENPAGKCIGFVAVQNKTNDVCAYYGVIPEIFSIDGVEKIIYQSCDTMTHSEHRRKGLFELLAVHCYNYVKQHHNFFIIGFGGTKSTPGLLKFGWQLILKFNYYFRPNLLCRLHLTGSSSDANVRESNSLAEIKPFFERTGSNAKIHAVRSVEHLAWRIRNPSYNYKIIVHDTNAVVDGYVIYYVLQENKIILFDFAFESSKSQKALLQYLSRKCVENKYKGLVAFCQENGLQSSVLKKSNFISNPFHIGPLNVITPFLLYSDQETVKKYSSPDNWEIRAYDHDAL